MQKSTTSNITDRYFDSIETMPIFNWNKIVETGDLKWLFISGSGRVGKEAVEVWNSVQDEYLKEFGIDQEFKKKLRLMKEVISLNDEFIQTGDRFLLNLINIAELDLKAQKQNQSVRFYDLLDKVMTAKKCYIDPKQYTVIQWFYALKNIANGEAN